MKRAKSSFLRMRAFCGDTEVTPIHRSCRTPHRVTEAIDEGSTCSIPAAFVRLRCGEADGLLRKNESTRRHPRRRSEGLEQITRDFAPL